MTRVTAIDSAKDFTAFVRVPVQLYKNMPYFVPRLDLEMKDHLSAKNPYFQHAQTCFFLALDEQDIPVGRISAQIDRLAQKDGQPMIGHFGLIEANHVTTLHALLTQAESWLRARGAKRVQGPYSLSINDETGLLVSGFDSRPRLMMNYAPDWYGDAIQDAGYHKAKDLVAYIMDVDIPLPAAALRMAQMAHQDRTISERALAMRSFKQDLSLILDIFNEAWRDNWGFVPMTAEEIAYTAKNMKPVIVPELARIAFVNNKPAAMIVALPDVNEAIADLDGKLLPFGWAKILWRLKITGLKGGRVLLMGVRKEFQSGPMASALASLLIARLQEAAQERGMKNMELSWILEDNTPTNRLIQAFGGRAYKTYRVFEKDLA